MVIISSIILVAAQSGRIFWTSLTIFPWRAGKTWQWGLKTLMNFSRWSLVQAPILPARGSTHQYWLWGLQSSFLQTHCGLACWSSLHGNWPGPMIVMAGCLMMIGSDMWVIICISLESNSRRLFVDKKQENNRIRLMGLGIPDHLCDISVVAGTSDDFAGRGNTMKYIDTTITTLFDTHKSPLR